MVRRTLSTIGRTCREDGENYIIIKFFLYISYFTEITGQKEYCG
jgi:hypothetical protein